VIRIDFILKRMSPLLLAFRRKSVSDMLVSLATIKSPVLKIKLLGYHISGLTSSNFAETTVNSLFTIQKAER